MQFMLVLYEDPELIATEEQRIQAVQRLDNLKAVRGTLTRRGAGREPGQGASRRPA